MRWGGMSGGEGHGADVRDRYRRALAAVEETPGVAGVAPAREALRFARALNDEPAEIALCIELSTRIGANPSASPEDYDEIIDLCSHALAKVAVGSAAFSMAAMTIGLAYGARSDGDLLENWRLGGGYLMRAAAIDGAAFPDLWARAQMNLGMHVAGHPYGNGDLDKAIALVRASLDERSPDKNVVDWAYSQANLASMLRRRGNPADAETSYRLALSHLRRDADPRLWAVLHRELAALLLASDTPEYDEVARLVSDVLEPDLGVDPRTAAQFHELAARLEVKRAGRHTSAAAEHRLQALALVPPDAHARLHLNIGASLLGPLFELGDVQRAADVAESTLRALELLLDAQTTPRGRSQALKDGSRVTRWAAFVLAAADRPQIAVEAIERGLARELSTATGRDTANMDKIQALDSDLAERYEAARAALRDASATGGSDARTDWDVMSAERELRRVIDEIRALEGCSTFMQPLKIEDIYEATGHRPIVYIVNCPMGSCTLTVHADMDGGPRVTARVIRDVTSSTIAGLLLVDGETAELGLIPLDFLDPIRRARFLPKVLDRLDALRPLAALLASTIADQHDRSVVVVPTGILGLLPLHAIPLAGAPGRVLDDVGEILLTPCAAVFAASLLRAKRDQSAHFVGVCDPTPTFSLPASRAELKTIARFFEQAGCPVSVQEGAAATKHWLTSHVEQATHLHLACHGFRKYLEPEGPVLHLANDEALDLEYLEKLRISCRMVVISGCHSGHYDTVAAPDEFTGLPAGFLQAGAACVISSLWRVDDAATAMLMVRLYELLQHSDPCGGMLPGAALRSARQWLRSLTIEAARTYAKQHPELSVIDLGSFAHAADPAYPFSQPQYWAAFSAWGF